MFVRRGLARFVLPAVGAGAVIVTWLQLPMPSLGAAPAVAAPVATNLSTEVMVELQEGAYALICVIPPPSDRIRHFAKGMVRPLLVTAPMTTTAPPDTAGTLVM